MNKRIPKNPRYKNTKRLAFRLLTEEDAELYCSLYADPEVVRYICTPLTKEKALISVGKALGVTQQLHFQRRVVAIVERESNKVIGFSHVHMNERKKRTAVVGSILTTEAQAKGYATEYSEALLAFVFNERPVDTLIGEIGVGNTASEALAKGFGFVRTGEIPASPDRPAQTVWTLTRAKWKKLSKSNAKPKKKLTRKPKSKARK